MTYPMHSNAFQCYGHAFDVPSGFQHCCHQQMFVKQSDAGILANSLSVHMCGPGTTAKLAGSFVVVLVAVLRSRWFCIQFLDDV